LNRIPERNEKIIWKTVQEEAVLLDSRNGRYFGLNPVGCSFWQNVDGKRALGEIINLLIEEYNIDRNTLVSDIEELVQVLKNKELLFIK
jgi:hypothetical protein